MPNIANDSGFPCFVLAPNMRTNPHIGIWIRDGLGFYVEDRRDFGRTSGGMRCSRSGYAHPFHYDFESYTRCDSVAVKAFLCGLFIGAEDATICERIATTLINDLGRHASEVTTLEEVREEVRDFLLEGVFGVKPKPPMGKPTGFPNDSFWIKKK